MSFFKGVITGFAAAAAGKALNDRINTDPAKAPLISEYIVRSVWMDLAGFNDVKPNPPLVEDHVDADIVIIGGGFTGLASAYHLIRKFPDKRIILLEAARCGYGSSGRNGGILQDFDNHLIMKLYEEKGIEAARRYYEIDRQGPQLIRTMVREHKIDCDLEECGVMELALDHEQMETLLKYHEQWESLGIESKVMDRQSLSDELNSERYVGGLHKSLGAILNPAKLALGIKKFIESKGVEVYEQTKVIGITPGSILNVETEFGNITANALVLGTNAYSHKIGYFRQSIFPIGNYAIATEPLSKKRLKSIGWKKREAMWDMRSDFNYMRLTADNRILIGGEVSPYFYGNGLSTGNYKPTLRLLEESLFKIWPQLTGIKVTHRWGGTLAMTLDYHPVIGVMGDYNNIYYGVGYSGHGVSWTQLAGKAIAELYAGEDTELTGFYCVNRTPPYLPPEPLRNIGFHLYKRFFLK